MFCPVVGWGLPFEGRRVVKSRHGWAKKGVERITKKDSGRCGGYTRLVVGQGAVSGGALSLPRQCFVPETFPEVHASRCLCFS